MPGYNKGRMNFSVRLRKSMALFQLFALCSTLVIFTTIHRGVVEAASNDWPTYLGSPAHTGYNAAETGLNRSNISQLQLQWSHDDGSGTDGISTQPVVSNGVVYWGSWDGIEHAYTISGNRLWETQIGQTTSGGCDPSLTGAASTATVGSIGSIGSTPVIYVGGGGNRNADGYANLLALNANTGAVIWKTDIGTSPAPATFLWGSSTLANGSVYIGTASLGDCPLVQGQLLRINASNGQIQAVFNAVPSGCTGGGIWSTPTITPDNKIYIVTGNPGRCSSPEPYSFSVLELNAFDLSVIDHWQAPISSSIDYDFGATMTSFSSGGQNYVGAINKNGIFYAFMQNQLSAGPVWRTVIANADECPQCGGNIAPAAFDGTNLYIGGGNVTINGTSCPGSVNALNPATGAFIWRHCLTAGHVLGAVTAFPGVVVVGAGNAIYAVNASTGATLYTFTNPNSTQPFWGAPTVAEDLLFAGNQDGTLFALGLPSSATYYEIINRNSGKVLDVPKGSTSDGTGLIQWSYHSGTNQQWRIVPIGNGYNKLVNRNSGKVLDVPRFSTMPALQLQQWTDNGGTNQQWQIISAGGGYYFIVSHSNGMVADVDRGFTTDNAVVLQWPNHAGTNQEWMFVPVS